MSQGATVLVVDDDEDTVDTMREILEEEGHVVLSATNGREALALTQRERPDLVLLDLNMPEMDGRAFLSAVRDDPALTGVRVVVLSGASDVREVPAESITKPLRLDTLLGLLRRAESVAP